MLLSSEPFLRRFGFMSWLKPSETRERVSAGEMTEYVDQVESERITLLVQWMTLLRICLIFCVWFWLFYGPQKCGQKNWCLCAILGRLGRAEWARLSLSSVANLIMCEKANIARSLPEPGKRRPARRRSACCGEFPRGEQQISFHSTESVRFRRSNLASPRYSDASRDAVTREPRRNLGKLAWRPFHNRWELAVKATDVAEKQSILRSRRRRWKQDSFPNGERDKRRLQVQRPSRIAVMVSFRRIGEAKRCVSKIFRISLIRTRELFGRVFRKVC